MTQQIHKINKRPQHDISDDELECNELLSLIKVNDKGWDTTLFKQKNKISGDLCTNCNAVCCDAVELGCDHNDDDIHQYCNKCLQDLINNNENKCPINNHSAPIIIPIRSIRRKITHSVVICPNSSKYKQGKGSQNADKGQIIDTQGNDEKKGHENNESGCNWSGSLQELISNHLTECITKYNCNDPDILKKENMKLKMEIKRLNQIINDGMMTKAMKKTKYFIIWTSKGYVSCGKDGWLKPVKNSSDAIIFEFELSSQHYMYTYYKVHDIKNGLSTFKGFYVSYKSGSWCAALYKEKNDAIIIEYCFPKNQLISRGQKEFVKTNVPQILSYHKNGYFYWYNKHHQCDVDLIYVQDEK